MSTIKASVREKIGGFSLHADFEIPGSGCTALFGRSGSGKTTILRWIAGLGKRYVGNLSVNNEVWEDSKRRIFVLSHQRAVGYVFQNAGLFPHLSVQGNLQYGLSRVPKDVKKPDLDQVIELLGLRNFLGRAPSGLSGGEKQRVAIARSLLTSPKVLLLDEPLSGLDVTSKMEILQYLERVKNEAKIPIIYVSHSLDEVTRLSDYIIQIENGGIVSCGAAKDVVPNLRRSVNLGEPALPPAVSFIGDSGAGKTTLIEAVISLLKAKGYQVGVIKHDAHEFEIDHTGPDTTVIASDTKLVLVSRSTGSIPVETIIASYFSNVDIVITEGYRASSLPKVLVMRSAHHHPENFDPTLDRIGNEKVIAIASDTLLLAPLPCLDLNQPLLIANFIEEHFCIRHAKRYQ